MSQELLRDEDGENRAVRSFLMAYGQAGITVGVMRVHMMLSGFPHWPDWVTKARDGEHLTKAGAQDWLRHLFALEGSSPSPVGAVSPLPEPAAPSLDVEAMLRACVPGGSICDPQQVADTIRAYFAADVMACRAGDPTGRKGNCACKWGGGDWRCERAAAGVDVPRGGEQ